MFHHQYPTRACVAGNGEVRSLWDNVPDNYQHQMVEGLGLEDMINIREPSKASLIQTGLRVLKSLNQNGKWTSTRFALCLVVDEVPSA